MAQRNFDLNSTAVGRASGDDAGTVLGALLETPGIGLVHEYAVQKAPAPAAPSAPGPGGSKPQRPAQQASGAATGQSKDTAEAGQAIVPEYEVFQNDNNAVAFFLSRQESADLAGDQGPFWFSVHGDNNIVAGSENGQVVFSNVAENVIKSVTQRGVILLVEFENQKPLRCTPCYIMNAH